MPNILLLIGICMATISVFILVGAIAWEMYTRRDVEKIYNFGVAIALFSIPFVMAYMVVLAFQKLI